MIDFSPLVAQAGRNDLDFAAPGLPDRKIVLRSARPKRFTAATPVLFVHHGVLRNGADYRDYWLGLVDEADVLVVAPEFPADSFPGAAWYNFGNRSNKSGQTNPEPQWTYGVDEQVFAFRALRVRIQMRGDGDAARLRGGEEFRAGLEIVGGEERQGIERHFLQPQRSADGANIFVPS